METVDKDKTNLQQDEYSGISLQPQQINKPIPLNSTWIFWYASRKEQDHHIIYDERLKKVAEFSDLQSFFHYYSYLKPIDDVERNADISLFKLGYKPCWESCQDGGCWFIRFKKTDEIKEIDTVWENMLFSLISEQFEEANVLGSVLSIRGRETILELWFNYFKYEQIKSGLLKKMETILGLPKNTVIYFKDNEKALVDKSTLRNAETYVASKLSNSRKGSKW
jgi:translation initiation factor 4E